MKMIKAYWHDTGLVSIDELHTIQEQMLARFEAKEKGDIRSAIIAAELKPSITFGRIGKQNKFADILEAELTQELAEHNILFRDEKDNLTPDALKYLQAKTRNGITFRQSERGGGAAYFGPGQRIYLFPVCLSDLTSHELPLGYFSKSTNEVLFETAQYFTAQNRDLPKLQHDFNTKESGRDIFYFDDKHPIKIGSKGYRVEKRNDLQFGKYGVSLFVKPEGLRHFDMIYPCGHHPDSLDVRSLEEITRNDISFADVDTIVREKIERNYGITHFKDYSL